MSLSSISNFIGSNSNLIGAGLGLLGQMQGASAAKDAASAQMDLANRASEMSKFTPYGVTTGFGSSWFDTEKQQAGYELDPALAAYRDRLMTMGGQALPQSMDAQANAQQYYNEMQAMMAPQRAQEQEQLQQNMFGSGRLGMQLAGAGAGAGAGGMYQPDVLGYNRAQELANQQLAQQSRAQSMAELDASIARGTGLFQQGLGVEQLGMTPLSLGAEIGGRATSAGANAGTALMQGGLAAANSNLAAGVGWMNTGKDLGLGLMKYNQPS